jgi:tRNA-splicing ligase RtcB
MQKISDKLYNWASIIDPNTLEQARLTSQMPFIYPHMALMPDAHLGKGATVGSVIPTLKHIIPAAVGVDIGCGMIAVKTQFKAHELPDDRTKLRQSIERSIPLSAGGYNREYTASARKRITILEKLHDHRATFRDNTAPNWRLQLGSLGSGNHFIEVSLDEDDNVWLFLHSGSRGVGNKLASYHINVAKDFCRAQGATLPHIDLAFLEEGTPEFDKYIQDLAWAQHFALLNREEMMDRLKKDFSHWVGVPVQEYERINCHHNFTMQEEHFGKTVYLSRKGAIDAHKGVMGLIPGSMGTRSYVVEGKGSTMGLSTAPHGAGRVYSRGEARRTFTVEQLREAMKGIEYRDTDAFLDEHPLAYKDIDQVMEDAKDLVEIKHTLRQIVNVKGD